jgi:hypothetical protein
MTNHTPPLSLQEVDAITSNTDKSAGPVFKPSRTDYQDTFTLGAKDSKQRTQYDTGAYADPDLHSRRATLCRAVHAKGALPRECG